jgi:hypothetical protein
MVVLLEHAIHHDQFERTSASRINMAKAKFIQGLELSIRNGQRRTPAGIDPTEISVPNQIWISALPDTTTHRTMLGDSTEGVYIISGPASLRVNPITREVKYNDPPNCPEQRPCWAYLVTTNEF